MDNIKIAEIFYSIQGEGLYTGVPSVFIRTFGCNFRCRGFSRKLPLPEGEKYNPEVKEILEGGLDKFKTYEDLPLVNTGCDTYAAIYPEFKKFSHFMYPGEIAHKVRKLTDPHLFNQNLHLIMTGGEPLLGWQKQYIELFEYFPDLTHLTFETNGTQMLDLELSQYLQHRNIEVTFSVSAKLSCSGETREKAIKPLSVLTYMPHKGYFKFVVANQFDVDEAQSAVETYKNVGINWPVYLMPAGGTTIHYDGNQITVADLAKKVGYRYSQRLQINLFGNQWGT